nr:GH116 family glycosyl-hydrolase [Candidatus Sigynarchaeota archaeon]
MIQTRFTHDELFNLGPQRVYKDKYLGQISFPLGGIGTGSISMSGRGTLQDFEFNRPNMGSKYPRTFAMLRVKQEGKDPVCRVLEGPVPRPYTLVDGGAFHANGEGFPHMDSCEFRGEYPFAWIEFTSAAIPAKMVLEAYNPFIPSDPDASSIPAAILKYHVTNTSKSTMDVSIAWSMLNIAGITPEDSLKMQFINWYQPKGQFLNNVLEDKQVRGVIFGNAAWPENHAQFGSCALVTPDTDVSITPAWKRIAWFNAHYALWNGFKQTGKLEKYDSVISSTPEPGAIAVRKIIKPGETQAFTFYITWYFPNFVKYWQGGIDPEKQDGKPRWKNHYATRFDDAFDVASRLALHEAEYHEKSKKFHDALFGSTLPPHVIDAIAANMAILKTATCLRLEDGTFYGFEGCNCSTGCCEGSCTHVWGYQQALPFLFPSLERGMHDANYKFNFIVPEVGALNFRIALPLGNGYVWIKPCADGQMGGVMHVYREWKLCGDDTWLKNTWPFVKRALDFAFEDWDEKKNGYLDNWQHNTYDVDFHGPNPMLTCYYLGALLAGAEMAKFAGDEKSATEYREIHDRGARWVDEHLWNGEYYIQLLDNAKAKEYQVGPGCLIDQLVGLEIARIAGLPNFLDHDHVVTTLKSIFKYNWKPNMKMHENGARLYAVNDEAATVICTWPKGGRPDVMFPYADEVMNGFEYQFAVHCIIEGLLEEGLTVVKSIRDRYDGWGRNPWDEFECGHHYARSMASYGLLIALSGFEFDKGRGYIGFNPRIHESEFRCFWSLDNAWGTYAQTPAGCTITVLHGNLELRELKIAGLAKATAVKITAGAKVQSVDATAEGRLVLKNAVALGEDQVLVIKK